MLTPRTDVHIKQSSPPVTLKIGEGYSTVAAMDDDTTSLRINIGSDQIFASQSQNYSHLTPYFPYQGNSLLTPRAYEGGEGAKRRVDANVRIPGS